MFEDAPARLPGAIEEVLRYDAPSQFQGRVAMRDVRAHGVTIPQGARVALVTGAACRDPREFPDPDRLDVRRTPERALYFGHGQHVCIGKSLARLEARVALEEVARRWPGVAGRRGRPHAHLPGARARLPERAARRVIRGDGRRRRNGADQPDDFVDEPPARAPCGASMRLPESASHAVR